MFYLWPQYTSMIELDNRLGVFVSPNVNAIPEGVKEGRFWALDNGAFTGFDEHLYLTMLRRLEPYMSKCLFVVAPDIIGNAHETIIEFERWSDKIRDNGYPVALVAQNGLENYLKSNIPDFDWLFVGGIQEQGLEWKESVEAVSCVQYALDKNKKVHVGRVNSWRRFKHFASIGCHSCDGTGPVYAPDNYHRLITRWMSTKVTKSFLSKIYLND